MCLIPYWTSINIYILNLRFKKSRTLELKHIYVGRDALSHIFPWFNYLRVYFRDMFRPWRIVLIICISQRYHEYLNRTMTCSTPQIIFFSA